MTLRRVTIVTGVALTIVTLVACVSLLVLTTMMRTAMDELIATQRREQLISELVNHAMAHVVETTAIGRSISEARARDMLTRARELMDTPADQRALDQLTPYLEQILQSSDAPAGPVSHNLLLALAQAKERFSRSLDTAARKAERLDAIANTIAIASACLLLLGVVFAVWWTRYFVFRPMDSIAGTIGRFADGDLTARATEQGTDELRRAARTYNELADALVNIRRRQLRYVATIVHDLRTPLAAIQLAAGYVAPDRPLPPESRLRDLFVVIERQLQRMNAMIAGVLGAVQIDTGELVLRVERCDLAEATRGRIEFLRSMAPTYRFTLELEGTATAVVDGRRIEQVIDNLLTNAVQYSPSGSRVAVSVTGSEDAVAIEVASEGIGIEPELQRQLFQPFARGRHAHEDVPGVGLGLYVSRRIVEAHGGTIAVDSAAGAGATFRVTLPRDRGPAAGAQHRAEADARAPG
jgi:signal transduction histidine kinase